MKFQILNVETYGIEKAIKASGNPMRTVFDRNEVGEKDMNRAFRLGATINGQGHDNFLKGCIVQFDVIAPLYWWKQAQRYHWFDFVSSQSTMHCLAKFNVTSQCVEETNQDVLAIVEKLLANYLAMPDSDPEKVNKWRELVASLPCGFCLGATMTTNYQQLKTMYLQRRHHKLVEWHQFCDFCDTLPYFKELTGVDKING